MTAKSTMEELRELNVRRQREAQQGNQRATAAPAPAPTDKTDKMIVLSNDGISENLNDYSITQMNELSNDNSFAHSSIPLYEDNHPSTNEDVTTQVKEPPPRQPGKGRGRIGQKSALSATDRLFAQTTREPIMRLNIELTESMHTQLKQYCVQHKVPIRMLVTALIEDFFAKETEGA